MTTTANTNNEMQAISDIVAAFAQRPDVDASQIADLYANLRNKAAAPVATQFSTDASTLGTEISSETKSEIPAESPKTTPAVPVENSVSKNAVTCLCCGKSFKMLKRHLGSEHNLTVPEYLEKFDLPEDHPIVAPSYSRMKAKQAQRSAFGKYDRTVSKGTKAESKGRTKASADS